MAEKWYILAAEQGDVDAIERLKELPEKRKEYLEYVKSIPTEAVGDFYYQGMIEMIAGRFEAAFDIFSEGSKNKDIKSHFMVALCLWRHIGTKYNMDQAAEICAEIFPFLKTLAEKGRDTDAIFLLSLHSMYGFCTGFNRQKALELCRQSAEHNNIFANLLLGDSYLFDGAYSYHLNVSRNKDKANACFSYICGNAELEFAVGLRYLKSSKLYKEDKSQAIEWIEMSAKHGCTEARDMLDEMHINKRLMQLIKSDEFDKSDVTFLMQIYKGGDAQLKNLLIKVCLNVGKKLLKENDFQSLSESIVCYEYVVDNSEKFDEINKAKEGLCNAYFAIACFNEKELLNSNKAIEYYLKSSEFGNRHATFALAMLYYEGEAKNYSKAIYYFKKCTELGVEEGKSHYYLGNCFYWGLGVPVDFELAKKHYISAYEYGFNCSYSIDVAKATMGETYQSHSMKEYAETIKKRIQPIVPFKLIKQNGV